ncbi:MAG: hypothetical protein E6Q97_38120 [Desulfurellales bacterium]|nr:MAG: hypothetical protein E6Q97_38120 [Desulfurellales bacterium]
MASIRLSNGSSSAVITGDLKRYVERVLHETQDEVVKAVRDAAEEVRKNARASWYTMVHEESGRSGDIRTAITVDPDGGSVSVAVGSVDSRRAQGKPTVVFVHAPFPGSLQQTQVSEAEYLSAPTQERAWIDHKKKRFFLWRPPSQPATGKYLLETLVKAPMRAKKKAVAQIIQGRAAKAAGGTSGR